MVTLDFKTLTVPVGIVRILEVVFTILSFSLAASASHFVSSFWVWCMFSWCSCFLVTFVIIILEFTSVNIRIPMSWDDFTTAFSMLATLMVCASYFIFFGVISHCLLFFCKVLSTVMTNQCYWTSEPLRILKSVFCCRE